MSRKGGIRKRLLEPADDVAAADRSGGAASSSDGRSGGIRKRARDREELQAAPAANAAGSSDVPLVKSLKKHWARGKLTSPQVQEFALGAMRQGAHGMQGLAAAGSFGSHPQNLQRSLMTYFGMPEGAPDFAWFKVPMTSGEHSHPFLLPHAWLSSLYHHRHGLWQSAIQGGGGAAASFWESMASTPIVRSHPHLSEEARSRTLPLGIHGDGGSFSKQDSLFVFTMNGLLGKGATVEKRFLLTVIKKSEIAPGTLDLIMDILAWSFNVALTGVAPEVDWAGGAIEGERAYLAGGWRGALIQVRGDWEFYTSVFHMPNWNAKEEMCWVCRATGQGANRFTSCGAAANWRRTRRSHEQYAAQLAAEGRELPILLQKVVGLRLEGMMIDVLHAIDLGVAAHIVGNIFWTCVKLGVWAGTTQAEQVDGLDKEMTQHYKDTKAKVRVQGKLTVARLRTSELWPKLKCKGAACRNLSRFALGLAQRHLGPRETAVAQLLVTFYDLISGSDMFLCEEAKRQIPAIGLRLGVLYSQLAASAFAAGEKGWKMNPKLHLFQHLCEWQSVEYGSPKFYSTYADEDMVGHMVECAKTCHPRTMAGTACFKWLTFSFGDED